MCLLNSESIVYSKLMTSYLTFLMITDPNESIRFISSNGILTVFSITSSPTINLTDIGSLFSTIITSSLLSIRGLNLIKKR